MDNAPSIVPLDAVRSRLSLDELCDLVDCCRPGGAVLDVGCGDGAFVRELRAGGYDAFGIDDATTAASCTAGDPAAAVPLDAASIGLAIIRGTQTFGRGVGSPEAVVGLANVLATIRGGGRVAIAVDETGADAVLTHFGLHVESVVAAEPIGLIGRLLGRRPRGPQVLVGVVPAKPLSKLEYHAIARDLAMATLQRAA